MFKYIKFKKVKDEFTTHEFRGGDEEVEVNYFDVDVVSIKSENESAINELITSQSTQINCEEITKEKFKELVRESAQIERIRTIVKERIASRYSIADEIALMKRDEQDNKRVDYEAYVKECITKGDALKSNLGY